MSDTFPLTRSARKRMSEAGTKEGMEIKEHAPESPPDSPPPKTRESRLSNRKNRIQKPSSEDGKEEESVYTQERLAKAISDMIRIGDDYAKTASPAYRTREPGAQIGESKLKWLQVFTIHKEQIKSIIMSHEIRTGDQVLKCETKPNGIYIVPMELRAGKGKKCPWGIYGSRAISGKQNFRLSMRSVLILGKLVDLPASTVNFEDPRDCYEIAQKLAPFFI